METEFVSVTETRTYKIVGAPNLQLVYGKAEFIPAGVVTEFRDGVWQNMRISGPNAKKDGTPGANHHENHYYGGAYGPRIPDWAQPFTDFNYRTEG